MVEYKELNVKVTKEAYEIGEGLKGIAAAITKAVADGWQPGTDLPAIIVESISAIIPAIEGYDKLPEEFKADLAAAVKGIALPVSEIPFMFIKKDAE